MSEIGFGASALGNVFGRVSIRDVAHAVHCAVDCGINFFDVSPYYDKAVTAVVPLRDAPAVLEQWSRTPAAFTKIMIDMR